jgi:hypothetical protein
MLLKTLRLICLGLMVYSFRYLEMALWTHLRVYLVVIFLAFVLAVLAIWKRVISQLLCG